MDQERFDRLTRTLASGQSRRGVLKGIGGGLMAGMLATFGRGDALADVCKADGCKGACTSAGFTGQECNPICGNGQFRGACPAGQGGGNPCCNPGLCNPSNFVANPNGNPVYAGPTSGC